MKDLQLDVAIAWGVITGFVGLELAFLQAIGVLVPLLWGIVVVGGLVAIYEQHQEQKVRAQRWQ